MDRLKGKVALVTGAAKGLGAATAKLFAAEGARVVLTDLDEKLGSTIKEEIVAGGGDALFLRQDVTDESEWERIVAACLREYGALNVVVNNAGIALAGSAETTTLEDWRKLMSVNLDAVFLGTKHAIVAMKAGVGSIINLSSVEGIVGDPNLAAYNASKGGVRIFTKSAALHCARSGYNVRVNSVHPGYIWTPMVEDFLKKLGDVNEIRKVAEGLHPVGHLGEPIDVAYGILYLASDESKFVTGSELVIDGGYTAQ